MVSKRTDEQVISSLWIWCFNAVAGPMAAVYGGIYIAAWIRHLVN